MDSCIRMLEQKNSVLAKGPLSSLLRELTLIRAAIELTHKQVIASSMCELVEYRQGKRGDT
jgi:hypothetical protein